MYSNLPDVQNSKENRGISIQWVGIDNYKVPFKIKTKTGDIQSTICNVEIYTDLSKENRGVNMSRYSQVIEKSLEKYLFANDALKEMLIATKDHLDSNNSRIIIWFPYFIKKQAPISKQVSHFVVDCSLCGVLKNDIIKTYLEVEANYISCCPCSKEMSLGSNGKGDKLDSGKGAHNQRSKAKIRVGFRNPKEYLWIEEFIDIIEKSGSCPIWNTLKRPDEKFVTEAAYNNPLFVEDVVREISLKLEDYRDKIDWYKIEVKHYESIHQSNAIAKIEKDLN